jgi:predicted glycogen debranching enzyme
MIKFGREICGNFTHSTSREWLVTNGSGGYASGTVAGALTRRYHGLLVAALKPPLGRTLLLAKLDETVVCNEKTYPLFTNVWAENTIAPSGYRNIEQFSLEGTVPVWRFACGDALLEKRIWMQQGSNTTYVYYSLIRATQPLQLTLKALVTYRDYHGNTQAKNWQMSVSETDRGLAIDAFLGATPFYLRSDSGTVKPAHEWNYGFELAVERYRGLDDREDRLHVANFEATLKVGQSLTFVASTEQNSDLNGELALRSQHNYEQQLIQRSTPQQEKPLPDWVGQLVLAADQFIVNRPTVNDPSGKTVIAGYHWFGDWGRDTMISLPGLTLATGRPEIARSILRTFARYIDRGMLPNRFPDAGEMPEYNTVDATLWYFEAIRAYYRSTQDNDLLQELFPALADIIDWHRLGTHYNIHLDNADGLLYAGEEGVQLTWMDAKVGDWVVTPRIGKPIEINALWYNALRIMVQFAQWLGKPYQDYENMANRTQASFARFWNAELGYCYDGLDGPDGNDRAFRPNQLFAISLPLLKEKPLLSLEQQQAIVDECGRMLLTSHGLRSLSPDDPQYQGHYGGNQRERDGAYHQGTVWGWLLGPFVQAHLQVYHNPQQARQFLEPMAHHLTAHGMGSLSEIFDGDAPMMPRGCIAQAWTVAEVLRAWWATEQF